MSVRNVAQKPRNDCPLMPEDSLMLCIMTALTSVMMDKSPYGGGRAKVRECESTRSHVSVTGGGSGPCVKH